MNNILTIAQVVVSALLIISVLLQKGKEIFGREASAYRTLRGAEKQMFIATIVLGFLFILLGLLNLLL